uniref:Small ribosomal subunit protein uS2 n=1 Tax=Hirondellea gigas TaxID=1518452 RepID=A0A6A7FZH0_9CRUS
MADVLALTEDDVRLMVAAGVHIGQKNLEADMAEYVHKRASSGVHIINLAKTWEKLLLAARVLVAIENPDDVCVVSSCDFGTRAAYKFGQYTGSYVVSGRYTPGTFTNQICKSFVEPRVLLVTDPRTDSQPVKEASYVNVPVIALCDTDSPLNCVDIAIPCNNRGKSSLAVMYWLLTREVLRMRTSISRSPEWEVMVDLFIYKDPEEAEDLKNEQQALARREAEAMPQHQQNVHVAYDDASYGGPRGVVADKDWQGQTQTPGGPEVQQDPVAYSQQQPQQYQGQQQQQQQHFAQVNYQYAQPQQVQQQVQSQVQQPAQQQQVQQPVQQVEKWGE